MNMVGRTVGERGCSTSIPLALYAIFRSFPSLDADRLLQTGSGSARHRLNPFTLAQPTLDHYRFPLQRNRFRALDHNTFIVTFGATVLSLFCSILIGYALGRLRFRGGNFLGLGHLPRLPRAADPALHPARRRSSPGSGSTTATGR